MRTRRSATKKKSDADSQTQSYEPEQKSQDEEVFYESEQELQTHEASYKIRPKTKSKAQSKATGKKAKNKRPIVQSSQQEISELKEEGSLQNQIRQMLASYFCQQNFEAEVISELKAILEMELRLFVREIVRRNIIRNGYCSRLTTTDILLAVSEMPQIYKDKIIRSKIYSSIDLKGTPQQQDD